MDVAVGPYDSIVSLGSNCAPARAIRRYFNCGKAYPFDWWISSLDELVKVTEQNYSDMFLPDEIEIYKTSDWGVRSSRYRISYHHDFKRKIDRSYEISSVLSELSEVKDKYERRFNRLRGELVAGRTLFVRYGIDSRGKTQEESLDSVASLEKAFASIWPESDWHLLVLPYEDMTVQLPDEVNPARVSTDKLGPLTGEMWREDQFFTLFRRRKLSLVNNAKSASGFEL